MKKTIFLTSLFVISTVYTSFAQLTIKGELRTRAELRHGYRNLPDESKDPSLFIGQRTRLIVNYKTEKYSTLISIQDARVWGDETVYSSTSVNGDLASLDLKEGWVDFILNQKSSLKIGRQEWVFDDERLLSARDWPNMGMSYDGILYKFMREKTKLNIGLSLNNRDENIFGNDYRYYSTSYIYDTIAKKIITVNSVADGKMKTLDFIHLSHEFSKKLSSSAILVASGWQKSVSSSTTYIKGTAGAYLNYKADKLGLKGSGFYQFGRGKKGQNVNAYMFSANVDYKMKKLSFAAGLDYISGHDASNTDASYKNSEHMFDLLYGNRHRLYGHLDYFSTMDKATRNGGLVDIYAKAKYIIKEKNEIAADYHYFMLQNNVYNKANTALLNKNLGSEFDFIYTRKISSDIQLKVGYSFSLPNESLEDLQNLAAGTSTFPYWGWAMITVKPVFFSSQERK